MSDVVQSPKVAAAVSTVTTGSGLATFLNIIPSDIGKLATLTGIILSVILIITHSIKSYRDGKKHKVEMEILEKRLEGERKIYNIKD